VTSGFEWIYGIGGGDCGISRAHPRSCEFEFARAIELGSITFKRKDFYRLIERLAEEFPVSRYNIFTHNCNHFTRALVLQLTGKHLPGSLTRATEACGCLAWCIPKDRVNGQYYLRRQQGELN
jgi:hypothetical protein